MKKSEATCRIIAGDLKNKPILLPDTPETRPTKAIVRESLFNTLQQEVIGVPFVEVFAGSGSVGLEAASRGASHVYFLEKGSLALKTLAENIARLGIRDKAEVRRGDSFEELPRILQILEDHDEAAFFYVDPPFSIRENQEEIYDKTTDLIASISPERALMIAVEHMTGVAFPGQIGGFTLEKSRKFGKTTLSYFLPAN